MFDVWAHSQIEVISGILNFVAMLISSPYFKTLLTVCALIGFLGAVISSIQKGRLGYAVNFFIGLALFMFILAPTATVTVRSVSSSTSTDTVYNVPYVIAFPLSLFTAMGKWLGEQSEQAMYAAFATSGMPSSSRIYNEKSAPGLALKVMKDYTSLNIPTDQLMRLRALFTDCIIPQAAVTAMSGQLPGGASFAGSGMDAECATAAPGIVSRTATACLPYVKPGTMSVLATPSLIVTDPMTGTTDTCSNYWTTVTNKLATWSSTINGQLRNWDNGAVDVAKAIRSVTGKLMGNPSIAGMTQEATAAQAFGDRAMGVVLGRVMTDLAASGTSSNEALKMAMTQTANTETGRILTHVMVDYMPEIADVSIAVICAFFPLAILVMVLTAATPERVFNYFGVMLSIAFWPPMIAVLNALMNFYEMQYSDLTNTLSVFGTLSPQSALGAVYVASLSSAPLSALGALFMSIPVVAIGLVKGGEVAFTRAFSGLTTHAQGTASQVALDRFSADSKSAGQHTGPTFDLEGASRISRQMGWTGFADASERASVVRRGSEIGHAGGVVAASMQEFPGASAEGAVISGAYRTGAVQTGKALGGARPYYQASDGGSPSAQAAQVGEQSERVSGVRTLISGEGLRHLIGEYYGDKVGNLDETSMATIARLLRHQGENAWEKQDGVALGELNAATGMGIARRDLEAMNAMVEMQKRGGTAIGSRLMARALGFSDVAEMQEAATRGSLMREISSSGAFDRLARMVYGGDYRKAAVALATALGADHAQAARAGEMLDAEARRQATDSEGHFHPEAYEKAFSDLATGEGAARFLAQIAQAEHGHELMHSGRSMRQIARGIAAEKTAKVLRQSAAGRRILASVGGDLSRLDEAMENASLHDLFELEKDISTGQVIGSGERARNLAGYVAAAEVGKLGGAYHQQRGLADRQFAALAKKIGFNSVGEMFAASPGQVSDRYAANKESVAEAGLNNAMMAVFSGGGSEEAAGQMLALANTMATFQAEGGGQAAGLLARIKAAGHGNMAAGFRQFARISGIHEGSQEEERVALALAAADLSDEDAKVLGNPASSEAARERILNKMESSMIGMGIKHGRANQVIQGVKNAILSPLSNFTGSVTGWEDEEHARDTSGGAETATALGALLLFGGARFAMRIFGRGPASAASAAATTLMERGGLTQAGKAAREAFARAVGGEGRKAAKSVMKKESGQVAGRIETGHAEARAGGREGRSILGFGEEARPAKPAPEVVRFPLRLELARAAGIAAGAGAAAATATAVAARAEGDDEDEEHAR